MTGIALSGLGSAASSDGARAGAGLLSGGTPSASSLGLAGLQAGSTILGAMSSLRAGQAKAAAQRDALRLSSFDDELNASQSFVAGQNQVTGLKQQLLATLGGRVNAAASSGVDTGQGIVQDTSRAIGQNAASAEALDVSNADIQSRRQLIAAAAARRQADEVEDPQPASVFGQLLGGATSIAKLLL